MKNNTLPEFQKYLHSKSLVDKINKFVHATHKLRFFIIFIIFNKCVP